MPVTDIYDHGGGFYFTLLLGRNENGSITLADSTGWLIGEGIIADGGLKGTTTFHGYAESYGADSAAAAARTASRTWEPRRVSP